MKKKKPNPKTVILKDTRESVKSIYHFTQQKFKDVQMIRMKLDVGDFSVLGCTNEITVERKTLADLCGSMGNNRACFERMWVRADDLNIQHRYIMVEGTFGDMMKGNYISAIHPNSLLGSLVGWSIKYKFSFFFVPDAKTGEMAIYYLMKNYLRIKKESGL